MTFVPKRVSSIFRASSPMKPLKTGKILRRPNRNKRYLTCNTLAKFDDKRYKFRIRISLKTVPRVFPLFRHFSFLEHQTKTQFLRGAGQNKNPWGPGADWSRTRLINL